MRHSVSSLLRTVLLVVLALSTFVFALSASAAPAPKRAYDPCHIPSKIASVSAGSKSAPLTAIECCVVYGKGQDTSSVKGRSIEKAKRIPLPPPCEEEVPATCGIAYSADAVVGSLPFETQAYWAAGKVANGVTVSAGTYWVNGVETAEDGSEYYEIIVSCQLLYVPVDTMQPSYEAPWNGEALPTADAA
jgi:hypothetical protein